MRLWGVISCPRSRTGHGGIGCFRSGGNRARGGRGASAGGVELFPQRGAGTAVPSAQARAAVPSAQARRRNVGGVRAGTAAGQGGGEPGDAAAGEWAAGSLGGGTGAPGTARAAPALPGLAAAFTTPLSGGAGGGAEAGGDGGVCRSCWRRTTSWSAASWSTRARAAPPTACSKCERAAPSGLAGAVGFGSAPPCAALTVYRMLSGLQGWRLRHASSAKEKQAVAHFPNNVFLSLIGTSISCTETSFI